MIGWERKKEFDVYFFCFEEFLKEIGFGLLDAIAIVLYCNIDNNSSLSFSFLILEVDQSIFDLVVKDQ